MKMNPVLVAMEKMALELREVGGHLESFISGTWLDACLGKFAGKSLRPDAGIIMTSAYSFRLIAACAEWQSK